MPARPHHLSSILKSFSTYVEHATVRGIKNDTQSGEAVAHAKESALVMMMAFLKQKQDFSRWTVGELEQFLSKQLDAGEGSQAAAELVTQFVRDYPPYQTSVFLHEYLLALKEDGCSETTIKNYRSDISQFMNFAEVTELEQLLQKPKVLEFISQQKKKGLQDSSIRRKLVAVTQFAAWAEKRGMVKGVKGWLEQMSHRSEVKKNQKTAQRAAFGKPTGSPFGRSATPTSKIVLQRKHESKRSKLDIFKSKNKKSTPKTWRLPIPKKISQFTAGLTQGLAQASRLASAPTPSAARTRRELLPYLNLAMIVLFFLGAGIFGYQQFSRDVETPLAYPTTLTRPNRDLSFQGRLTDTAYNPITSATNMQFKLYDNVTGGSLLWESGTCSITPDQDGIFTSNLGDDCGSEITDDVFTENANVWLEVTIAAETLDPRQPIKSVAYALNAETVQGYPASASAVENTVIVMDNNGEIVLGNATPVLKSTGASFAIEAQALTLQTSSGSDGDITLSPDGTGRVNINSDLALDGFLAAPGATLSANYAEGVALVLKGGPSGTGDIQQWQNSAGTVLSVVDSAGNVGIGSTDPAQALDVVGNAALTGDLAVNGGDITSTGSLTLTPTTNLNLNSTGDMTFDSSADIILDADGADVIFKDGGTALLNITNSSSDVVLQPQQTDKDLIFKEDGGTEIARLDSSAESLLIASSKKIEFADSGEYITSNGTDLTIASGNHIVLSPTANVGIGTTSPGGLLDIGGSSQFRVDSSGDLVKINNVAYTWPDLQAADSGYVLSNDGAGNLSWVDSGTGAGLWAIADNVFYPKEEYADVVDVMIGGIATASADIHLYSDGRAVFNEQGNDSDFRIESDTNVNAFFLQASDGSIGLGTNDPDGFEVDTAVAETAQSRDNVRLGVSGGTPRIVFEDSGNNQWEIDNSGGTMRFYQPGVVYSQLTTTAYEVNRLRDYSGGNLSLQDDAGNVGIGTTSPNYKFSIGSTDSSNQLGLYHNNTDAYLTTDDGSFIFITDEGTNTNSVVEVKGKGTGYGQLKLYDQDDAERLEFQSASGIGSIYTAGTSPDVLSLQYTGNTNVELFRSAAEGKTAELHIHGYRTSDALRQLEIGVGVDAADTASFDGVSNYYFDGNVGIGTTSPSSFKLETAGSIGPSADSSYDLGSLAKAWANIYGDTIYQGGNQVCDDSGNCTNAGLWQNTLNVFHPRDEFASVVDLTLGGTATASADIHLMADGSAVFNEQGNDADFRIEGSGAANAFFVQGSDGNVGIGTTSTSYKLDVSGTGRFTGAVDLDADLELNSTLTDINGSVGTSGQILSSTGTGVDWIDISSIGYDYWQIQGDTGGPTNVTDGYLVDFEGGEGIDTAFTANKLTISGEDATISNKGIASFSDSYFSVSSGAVSIDDIYLLNTGDTGTGAYTFSGGIFSVNASSNFATNINTGTSTGAVSIGGNLNTVAIDSSSWDINSAGVGSGFTQLTVDNLRLDGNTLSSTTGAVTLQPLSGQNLNVTLATTGDFAVNTNQLYVDTSAGNVGIGTTGPGSRLVVKGSGATSATSALNVTNSSDVSALFVRNDGNVGIGTTNPGNKFEVYKAGSSYTSLASFWDDTADGDPMITIGKTSVLLSDTGIALGYDNTGNYGWLVVGGEGKEQGLVIANGGNVGIGTTTPGAKLEVADTYSVLIGGSGLGVGANVYANTTLYMGTKTANSLLLETGDVTRLQIGGTGDFNFNSGQMFVQQSTGNVGIGTTDPGSYKLNVAGTGYFGNNLTIASSYDLYSYGSQTLGNRTYTEDNYVADAQTFTASIDALDQAVFDLSGGSAGLWKDAGAYIYADNTASDDVVVTDTGNVGIGTTGPNFALDVEGSINAGDPSSAYYSRMYATGSYGYFITNAPATYFSSPLRVAGGGIGSYTGNTYLQTAGTTGLTLTTTGNVGIGTTAPANALAVISTTTPQLRVGYDNTTNYLTTAVSSAGAVTLDAAGSSAGFTFNDPVTLIAAKDLTLASGTGRYIQTFTGTTTNAMSSTANSLTTGTALNLSSTATAFSSGKMLSISKTGASGSTAFTGDIANLAYTQTFNGGVGLNSTGNALDISRAITLNNAGNTHTVSGALLTLSDSGTQTAGTLAHTASVIDATQNYTASTGTAFYFKNYGAGDSFRVDDVSGDTSPFVIDAGGNVGIGSASPSYNLDVVGTTGIRVNDGASGGSITLVSSGTGVSVGTFGSSGRIAGEASIFRVGSINRDLRLAGGAAGQTDYVTVQNTSGNLGIGTTSPGYQLDVVSGDAIAARFDGRVIGSDAVNSTEFVTKSQLDALSTGSGIWTDTTPGAGSGIVYLTSATDDLVVGGTTLVAPFSVDESANTVRIGEGSGSNAILNMYASDGDTGSITYTTNDSWAFEGGNVGIGSTSPGTALDVVGTGRFSTGIDANAASTIHSLTLDGNTGTALNISGTSFVTDINLQNGETIDNDTNGIINFKDGSNSLAQFYDAGTVGNLFVTGGISTYDTTVTDGYVEASGICLGNGTNCITSWSGVGYTASNGLTLTGQDIELGGTLEKNTDIATAGYNLTISGTGNVGIGTSTVPQKLTVSGNIQGSSFLDHENTAYYLDPAAAGTSLLTAGNVGIGTTAAGEVLQVAHATSRGAIRIYQVDDATSDHLQFYNGATRMGEIGTQDTTWLRINQVTAKNIYTPRYIRADAGMYVGDDEGIVRNAEDVLGTVGNNDDFRADNFLVDTNTAINDAALTITDVNRYVWTPASGWGEYWDTTNNQIDFYGGGTERAWLDLDNGFAYFSGNVGIGSTAPAARLDIGGSSSTISNTTSDLTIDPAEDFIVDLTDGNEAYIGEKANPTNEAYKGTITVNQNRGVADGSEYAWMALSHDEVNGETNLNIGYEGNGTSLENVHMIARNGLPLKLAGASDASRLILNSGTIDVWDTNDRQALFRADASAQNDNGWATATVDYGEFMEKLNHQEEIKIFEVVGVKNNRITKNTDDAVLYMVTSTDSGIRGGNPLCENDEPDCSRDTNPNWLVTAFVGQVPILVDGTVNQGDYILPSGNHDGRAIAVSPYAISASQMNQVIGRALESSSYPYYERQVYDPSSDSEVDREIYNLQRRRGSSHIINVAVSVNFGLPTNAISNQQQLTVSNELKVAGTMINANGIYAPTSYSDWQGLSLDQRDQQMRLAIKDNKNQLNTAVGSISTLLHVGLTDTSQYQLAFDPAQNLYQVTPVGSAPLARAAAFSQVLVGKLRAGLIDAQQLVVSGSGQIANLSVNTLKVGGKTIQELISNAVTQEVSDQLAELPSPIVEISPTPADANQDSIPSATDSANASSADLESTRLGELLADSVNASSISAQEAEIDQLSTNLLIAESTRLGSILTEQATISGELTATSARIAALEAGMAELESVRAVTAELTTATVSGTLYAAHIDKLDEQIAEVLKKPSLADLLTGSATQDSTATTSASLAELVDTVESAGFTATNSAELDLTLADLGSISEDAVLTAEAAFINSYFKVNGSAYVADALGVGQELLVGGKLKVGDRVEITQDYLAFATPTDPSQPHLFQIQPSGEGTLALLGNLLILDESGMVMINGDAYVAGDVRVEDTLLADLLQPTDFGNPLQVQVAGLSTDESGNEVKKESRFEIVNELGAPVATISAEGKAQFAGGIGVDADNLGAPSSTTSAELAASKTSGRATIPAGTNQLTINHPEINADALIYVTPLGSTANQVLYVKSQTPAQILTTTNPDGTTNQTTNPGSFIVGFDSPTPQAVEFNWWIVN